MTNKNKGRKRAKDYKEQIIRDLRKRRLKKKIQIGVSGNTISSEEGLVLNIV